MQPILVTALGFGLFSNHNLGHYIYIYIYNYPFLNNG